jgi:hypothetical protein
MGSEESQQEMINEQIDVNADTHSNAVNGSDFKLLTTTKRVPSTREIKLIKLIIFSVRYSF